VVFKAQTRNRLFKLKIPNAWALVHFLTTMETHIMSSFHKHEGESNFRTDVKKRLFPKLELELGWQAGGGYI
jgi:hypothetical protein